MTNATVDIDIDLYEESIAEVTDLLESIETIILAIVKGNTNLQSEKSTLLRDIHSVKGSLGMIGHEQEMEYVHQIENYIDYSLKNDQELHFEFLYDFFGSLNQKLLGEPYDETVLESVMQGISLPRAQKIIEVTEEEQVTVSKTLVIAKNQNVLKKIDQHEVKYSHLYCINEIYLQNIDLSRYQNIIIHIDKLKLNPFLLLNSLKYCTHCPNVHYIASSTSEVSTFLKELPGLEFNFTIYGSIDDICFKNFNDSCK